MLKLRQSLLFFLAAIIAICPLSRAVAADSAPPGEKASASTGAKATSEKERVTALVGELGSKEWKTRQQAQDALIARGADVLALLDPALATATDPEVLWRLERVYSQLVPVSTYAGEITSPGFLGVTFRPVTADDDPRLATRQIGVAVDTVQPDSAAEQAGLLPGDLITAIDGQKLIGALGTGGTDPVVQFIQQNGAGATVRITLFRGDEPRDVTLTLGGVPGGLLRPPMEPAVRSYRWKRYWPQRVADVKARYADGGTPSSAVQPDRPVAAPPKDNPATPEAALPSLNDGFAQPQSATPTEK